MEISPDEIRELFENQSTEFKKSSSLQKEALEALCGMINSDCATGTVLFGISSEGSICGVEEGNMDSVQKKLAQKIRQRFDPSIISNIEVLRCGDKMILRLRADRAPGVSYHEYGGRAYIREGSTSRQLSYDEKTQLFKKRDRDQHSGPWKCNGCGSIVGTMLSLVITDPGAKKSYVCECGGEFWPIS